MTDLLMRLSLATLTSSAAMLVVLILRKPVRRVLHAQAAYALWALVPLATVAALMPSRVTTLTMPHAQVAAAAPEQTMPEAIVPAAPPTGDPIDASSLFVTVWLAGVAATLALFVLQQRRFVRGLGQLSKMTANVVRAETFSGCPALVGTWAARIVLPADFVQRYDAVERSLILAHERHHRSHGDAQLNAFCVLLRSVFWFNPLIHYAASYYRLDQELACDAAVIRAFRGRRRSYARAMLKAQLPASQLPLGCHWPAGHALNERVRLLSAPVAGPLSIGFGAVAAIALVAAGTVAAWAAQPARLEIRYTDRVPDVAAEPPMAKRLDDGDRASATTAAKADRATAPPTSAGSRVALPRSAQATNTRRSAARDVTGSATAPDRVDSQRDSIAARSDSQAVAVAATNEEHGSNVESAKAADASTQIAATSIDPTKSRPAEAIPSYRTRIPPVYPAAAVRMPGPSASSTIVLKVDVDERGNPLGAQVASMDPPSATELAAASIAAVVRWQFNPALRDGKPVAGIAWVPFKFVLQGGATSPPLGEITDGSVAPMRRASYRTLTTIDYPQQGALAGVEGVVYVKVRIGADGRVASLAVDRVEPESARSLADAATTGINTWTFNPARIAGRDVASSVTVPIVFTHERGRRLASNGHDYPGTLDPVMAIPKG